MAMARESTFLPTIKCSSCGNEVQISLMGEHICGGGTDAPASPPLDTLDEFPAPSIPEKADRLPSPVNVGAANQLYSPAQLTPLSPYDESVAVSPLSFGLSSKPRPLFSAPDDHPQSETNASGLPTATRAGGYDGFEAQGSPQSSLDGRLGQSPLQGGFLPRTDSMVPGPLDANRRPSTASLNPSLPQDSFRSQDAQRPTTANSAITEETPNPLYQARENGYGGLGANDSNAQSASFGGFNRSETFPRLNTPSGFPPRTSSTPALRPEHSRKVSMGPDTSRPPPPRKSLIRPANTNSIDLAAEFGSSNPYHTPSDSASSGYSTFSTQPSYTSAQTSPARSQNRRRPSDVKGEDQVPRRVESFRPDNLHIEPLPLHPAQQRPLRTPSPLIESPFEMSPHRHSPGGQTSSRDSNEPQTQKTMLSASPEESPVSFGGRLQRTDTAPAWVGASPPSTGVAPPQRKASAVPNRGDCKACSLPITGKSISSADGRLTGKYHKACFVCATCSEPFRSAEFYVLNDKPYCEQHYHKLNHSLCGSCATGIEGQYLEDETSLKYHVGCFRCLDCGYSLSEGYFEVDGGSYCEKDAMARVQRAWDAQHAPSPPLEQGRFPPGPPRGAPGLPRGGPAPRGGPRGAAPGPRPMGRGPVGLPSHPGPRGRGRGGMPPSSSRGGFPGMPKPAFAGGPTLNKRSTRLGMM